MTAKTNPLIEKSAQELLTIVEVAWPILRDAKTSRSLSSELSRVIGQSLDALRDNKELDTLETATAMIQKK